MSGFEGAHRSLVSLASVSPRLLAGLGGVYVNFRVISVQCLVWEKVQRSMKRIFGLAIDQAVLTRASRGGGMGGALCVHVCVCVSVNQSELWYDSYTRITPW